MAKVKKGDKKVKKGDKVKIDYIGKYENGEVFDASIEDKAKEHGVHYPERKYGPLEVEIGAGNLVKGFEEGLIGMGEGEEKEIKISPAEGYGERREDLLKKVPIGVFNNQGVEPKVGMQFNTPKGVVEVKGVSEEEGMVEVDFNHPLAGQNLVFWMKVVGIK
ncbi:MAG: peptidylprolyl isomerase [Candidatus Hydrothermarchaeaceae archaeon]